MTTDHMMIRTAAVLTLGEGQQVPLLSLCTATGKLDVSILLEEALAFLGRFPSLLFDISRLR